MTILVMLNNFLHDFCAAGWIFGTLILWAMLRKISLADVNRVIIEGLKMNRLLMRLSLAGIVVFGVIRALAYRAHEWNAAAGRGQVVLLVVKHIILAAVVAAGLLFDARAGKMIRKAAGER